MLNWAAALGFASFALVMMMYGQQRGSVRGFVGLALEDGPQGRGVRIADIAPGNPAAKAGLEPGDWLLGVNGMPANLAARTSEFIRSLEPGHIAHLSVVRGRTGQRQEIAVTVGIPSGGQTPVQAPASMGAPVPMGQQAAVPSNVRFERLSDPLEQAFTIEAPAGWKSICGLARTGLVQVNPYLRSLSPDKLTYFLFGDPTFPTFLVPTPMRSTIGLHEGSVSYEGVGGRSEIRRYQPGGEFARYYGQVALGGLCHGLRFAGSRDLPDLARKIELMDRNVIPTRYDAGEAQFTCVHNKQEMFAYAAAVTWITRDQIGMWVVRGFVAAITPKDKAGEARGVLQHITDSLRWEPAWNQRQSELSHQANAVIQARIAGFERQQAAFNAKLNAMDQSFQEMDDIITGRSQYYDSQTGTYYDLSNTTPYKWINDGGRVVGTDTDVVPPGYFWRPLPRAGGR